MSDFMKILCSLSVSGTLLLFLVLGLKPVYRHICTRCWQYYILLAVALRFLLPVATEINLTGLVLDRAQGVVAEVQSGEQAAFTEEGADTVLSGQDGSADNEGGRIDSQEDRTDREGGRSEKLWGALFVIWSVVFLVLLTKRITAYRRFVHALRREKTEIGEAQIWDILEESREMLHVRRKVGLSRNRLLRVPLTVGFFRTEIILPDGELQEGELHYIFRHELIHCKRLDLLYKWLLQAVVCIHWFNPFVLLLEREGDRACELACDEAVASGLNENEKRRYGDMLLRFAKAGLERQNMAASVSLTGEAAVLKERLGALMERKRKLKTARTATCLITAAIVFCFMTAGVYAVPAESAGACRNGALYAAHTYRQSGLYCEPYIFEIGWNLTAKQQKEYRSRELVLDDGSSITVFWTTPVEAAEVERAAEALGRLITQKNSTAEQEGGEKIEAPLISRITFAQSETLPTLALAYYEAQDLTRFSAIFPWLEAEIQKEFYNRIYEDNGIAFFSSVIGNLEADQLITYANRAERDGKINFFAVLVDEMLPESQNLYAEKYYEEGNIAGFAALVSHMSETENEKWLERARQDRKTAFCGVLEEELAE